MSILSIHIIESIELLDVNVDIIGLYNIKSVLSCFWLDHTDTDTRSNQETTIIVSKFKFTNFCQQLYLKMFDAMYYNLE